ncbi:MAG: PEP/pyruvate-binding domain-containing protein [Patescibacteria group bacterium]|nr:PEP/pyruvate-binding domain-containing protein [Patescibacteria group bacterium]
MLTKELKQLSKRDVAIAGSKSVSLGIMMRAGILIPSGFVVLAPVFEEFLEQNNLKERIQNIIKNINYHNPSSVLQAWAQIAELTSAGRLSFSAKAQIQIEFKKLNSKHVAVRSSATVEDAVNASWAGQFQSYFNVNQQELIISMQKCWSSLFTPNALMYGFKMKLLDQKKSMAVIVQKMILPQIAGTAFTVHPVTKNKNHILIEAGPGPGEAVVQGRIIPSAYIVDKKQWKILRIQAKQKENILPKRIIRLAKLCYKIEKLFKRPQDIEWALKGSQIYILQSRAITTL